MNKFRLIAEIYALGIEGVGQELVRRWGFFMTSFWNHVSRLQLLAAFDDVLGMFSGSLGLILTIPDRGIAEKIVQSLTEQKLHNKLIRVDEAARGFFLSQADFITFATGTGQNSVGEVIVRWFARFSYQLVKNIQLLRSLLKVKNEADMIELLLKKFLGPLRLARFVGTVLAIVATVLKVGVIVSAIGFSFGRDSFDRFILPQTSLRKRVSCRGKSVRKRLGPS